MDLPSAFPTGSDYQVPKGLHTTIEPALVFCCRTFHGGDQEKDDYSVVHGAEANCLCSGSYGCIFLWQPALEEDQDGDVCQNGRPFARYNE